LIRSVVAYPDERLIAPTVPVQVIDDRIRQLVTDLADTLRYEDGAGIAAPQIGAPERIFLVAADVAGLVHQEPQVFINPELTWLSPEAEVGKEACLSFPSFFSAVPRHAAVHVRALDADGEPIEVHAEGFYARVIQHEHDHLIGKLLIDRAISENE